MLLPRWFRSLGPRKTALSVSVTQNLRAALPFGNRAASCLTLTGALLLSCKSGSTDGRPLDERSAEETVTPQAARRATQATTTGEATDRKSATDTKVTSGPGHASDATLPQASTPQTNAPPTDAPRVYAKSRHVWIRSMPTNDVQWIGFLWWGGSVKVRPGERVLGAGCEKEWVPVEPRGYVCVDDERATENPKDEALLSIFPFRPDVSSPWPHQYAAVHEPARRYEGIPLEENQKAWERGYERHISAVRAGRSEKGAKTAAPEALPAWLDPSLSGKQPPPPFALPEGLSEGHPRIASRSAITYAAQADFSDRAFLLTGDLNWVPKDRVEILPRSEFQGVSLTTSGLHLPLAFFRGKDRPAFKQTKPGVFEAVPDHFRRLDVVQLSEQSVKDGHTTYYKLEREDLWVSSREAVVPAPKETTPWGEPVGQTAKAQGASNARQTWLEVSILGGWLVAFEGTVPVYATMISAGRGGGPHPDKDPLETASTPTGRFSIGGKFKTATMMSSSTPIIHMDVPWTQNFSGPHAIHSAYWHDDWGSLKSAGCINVSPRDGKWLFEFTEPQVPEGWHGVRYVSRYGGGSSVLIVHE